MKPVSEYDDPAEVKALMDNAERLGRDDVYWQAFRRLCVLQAQDYADPLERDFHEMLIAYEELLTIKNGKATKASRTRQMLKNKSIVQCLEDWAKNPTTTEGFRLLIEKGMPELTGEYIVLRYPERFSDAALASARSRLDASGVEHP